MKVSALNISVLIQGESSNFLLPEGVGSGFPVPVVTDIHSYEGAAVTLRYGGLIHIRDLPGRQRCLPAACALCDRANLLMHGIPYHKKRDILINATDN